MKALVVNGSATERAVFGAQLTWTGLEPETAATAEEAVEWLERGEEYVAVLLSWQLQDWDGLTLLRRLRSDPRWASLPVIMVTRVEDLPRIEEAHESGASEYLMQPSDPSTLLEKLLILGVDPEQQLGAQSETHPEAPRRARPGEDPEARRAA